MTKPVLRLALLLLVALPLFAQTSEFGFSFGAVDRLLSTQDKKVGITKNGDWKSGAKEIYFAVQLEPGMRFKIKAGQVDTSVITDPTKPAVDGRIQHVEGILDYRFSEPFGSTGLFAGAGAYRQTGGSFPGTNYGLTFGVNGDFPINPRFGVVVEAAYHRTHLETHARFITATAGLRVSF